MSHSTSVKRALARARQPGYTSKYLPSPSPTSLSGTLCLCCIRHLSFFFFPFTSLMLEMLDVGLIRTVSANTRATIKSNMSRDQKKKSVRLRLNGAGNQGWASIRPRLISGLLTFCDGVKGKNNRKTKTKRSVFHLNDLQVEKEKSLCRMKVAALFLSCGFGFAWSS